MFPEVIHAPEHLVADPATSTGGENLENGAEVCHPLQNAEEQSVVDEEVVEPSIDLSSKNIVTSVDSNPAVQDDAPRKSYASIVRSSS